MKNLPKRHKIRKNMGPANYGPFRAGKGFNPKTRSAPRGLMAGYDQSPHPYKSTLDKDLEAQWDSTECTPDRFKYNPNPKENYYG